MKYHCCCSVTKSCPSFCNSVDCSLPDFSLHCPSLSPRVGSNSCPLSWWCYLSISSSATLFTFCLQSLPASGSFLMSWLFTSKVLQPHLQHQPSTNIQLWSTLGLTGLISLLSKGLSRGFSNTRMQKRQFFSIQLSLRSYSHIHTWLLEKQFDFMDLCGQSNVFAF